MPQTDRERFINTVLGQPTDRAPYYLFWGPWGTAWDRWKREGKPEELADFGAVQRHFGADRPPMGIPVNCGPCPQVPRTVIEETDEHSIATDSWGIVRKNIKSGVSMPQFLSFPVKSRADWERYRAERLDPHHPDRLAGDWRQKCQTWADKGYPLQLGYFPDVGIFGTLRWLLGDEECLYAFHDDPDLVHQIMEHMTLVYLTVFEQVVHHVRVDVIHLWEDMCGRQGPLISPTHWEEFMGPCYRLIRRFAQQNRIPVVSVDTDGWPGPIVAPMHRAGVNLLFPLEVAAGCDVNAMQAEYPSLAFLGGIDKRALAGGPAAIDRELERIRPAIQRGRYLPELDHLIPDDVSWPNFAHFAQRLREVVMDCAVRQ